MRLTPILAGERIARASATSRGVVRRPAEQDGIQLDDEDGTFIPAWLLRQALVDVAQRMLERDVPISVPPKKRRRR